MKKKLLWAFLIFLIVALCIAVKLFLIGEPVDGNQLIYSVTENEQSLVLNVCASDSAAALRGWKYRQDGNTLYISTRKVLVSPFFSSGIYQTTITPETVTEIYLSGKLIWTAK